MGVEEGGFTSCAEREEGTRSDCCWWEVRTEKVIYIYIKHPFSLTCRETHGNNDFCPAGGERGRRWVVQPRSGVNLPLEVKIKEIHNTDQTDKCILIKHKYVHCTHRVKFRHPVGGALPSQEELLWGVELQPDVQSKLQKQEDSDW